MDTAQSSTLDRKGVVQHFLLIDRNRQGAYLVRKVKEGAQDTDG